MYVLLQPVGEIYSSVCRNAAIIIVTVHVYKMYWVIPSSCRLGAGVLFIFYEMNYSNTKRVHESKYEVSSRFPSSS